MKSFFTISVLLVTVFLSFFNCKNKEAGQMSATNSSFVDINKQVGEVASPKVEEISSTPFILDKEGVGCLRKGMLISKIPPKCEGLYDRIEKKHVEDGYGDYTLITFYLGTEIMLKVHDEDDIDNHVIHSIIAYSSKISTPDGVYPGMPIKDLLTIKGVETYFPEGAYLLFLNEYVIGFDGLTDYGEEVFNEAYMKGTDVKLSNACFKENAKVYSISN